MYVTLDAVAGSISSMADAIGDSTSAYCITEHMLLTPTEREHNSVSERPALQDSAFCTFVKGDRIVIQVARWVWME